MTSVHSLCEVGNIDGVKKYLSNGGNIEARENRGRTLLAVSLRMGNVDLAKYLVRQGADVNATNVNGTTVFMFAKTPLIGTGDYRVLEWLLCEGAKINARDGFGKTVLDYVVELDHAMSTFLKANGAECAD